MTAADHSAAPPVSAQVAATEAMNQRIRERGECVWKTEINPDDNDIWNTECLNVHLFTVGGPKENEHKFCPYCGKVLVVK